MIDRRPQILDMRLDGSFRTPPQSGVPLSVKLMVGAAITALVAGSIAVAALALWVFSMVLPVLLVAGLFGWGMVRYRRWQAGRLQSGRGSIQRY